MPKKTFTPEHIVLLLKKIDIAIAQGRSIPQGCKEYGGLQFDPSQDSMFELKREHFCASSWMFS